MKTCGLDVELVDDKKCSCCKGTGTKKRLQLKKGTQIGRGMDRLAKMLNDEKNGFCLDINIKADTIDRFGRGPKQDSQLNPDLLVATRGFKPAGASGTYNRSACSMLAHVFGENWWFKPTGKDETQQAAHGYGTAEENYVRVNRDGEPSIEYDTDRKVQTHVNEATKKIRAEMDAESKK